MTFIKVLFLGSVTLLAVSVSAQNNDAGRSLTQAIQRGDTALVSRIIDSGTTPNVKDDDGVPALTLATLFADTACVELLLKRIVVGPNASVPGATVFRKRLSVRPASMGFGG
jgi:ankyrin repeat protein